MTDRSKITEQIVPIGVWKAPQNPFVKINFDAGFCKQDNRSCSEIIIRNKIGNIFYSKTVLHANISSPFATEAMAYFQAVLTGAQMCFLNVEVEGDCLSVIHNLKDNRGEQSLIGEYIHNICVSCVIFQNCVFHHVQKHINGVAYALATEGLKRNEATYLVGDVPAYALDAIEVDRI
ncbi:hypothetical protein Golob_017851 [Gossypium lobatum]|uniref:RNase H type-1 domain-containing protein n=1 Tax=Gossypium lobatum TaxID=34289 RepID=A0A7J8M8E7_9ROSI|nr:hypothetical protein [Gossypium lobatum]